MSIESSEVQVLEKYDNICSETTRIEILEDLGCKGVSKAVKQLIEQFYEGRYGLSREDVIDAYRRNCWR